MLLKHFCNGNLNLAKCSLHMRVFHSLADTSRIIVRFSLSKLKFPLFKLYLTNFIITFFKGLQIP